MSDYLGHLLARTLTPNLGVRPRLPSMFEPPTTPTLPEQPYHQSDFETKTASAIAPRPPQSRVEPEFPDAVKTANAPGHSSVVRSHNTTNPPASVTAPSQDPEEQPVPHSPPTAPVLRPGVRSMTLPGEFPQPTRSPVPVSIRTVDSPTAASEPSQPPPAKNLTPTITPRLSLPANSPSPETGHRDSGRESTPPSRSEPKLPLQYDSSPVPDTALPLPVRPIRENIHSGQTIFPRSEVLRSPPPGAEPAPPTIQVTIGRLEVRAAIPTPAASRPRSKKEPAMSLETYLQRRSEGGRR